MKFEIALTNEYLKTNIYVRASSYYINYFTKAMQLEDPRKRYKQLQNDKCSSESIAMQVSLLTRETHISIVSYTRVDVWQNFSP